MSSGEFTPRYSQDEQAIRDGLLASMHLPPNTPGLELVSTQELDEMAHDMRMPGNAVFTRNPDNPLAFPLIEDQADNAEYDVLELSLATPPSIGDGNQFKR